MILIAGASGFVGRALLDALAGRGGEPVRALVRREFDAVRLRNRGVEAMVGNLTAGAGLDTAMRGVQTFVYLAHTPDLPGDPVANELTAAQNATLAARSAGVQRVVHLGPIARYLVARWAVELAVRQSGMTSVVLRAPIIVGDGGTLFEMMRRFVNRSLVVPLFGWRRVAVEPVALSDVVEALTMAIDDRQFDERSFDVSGGERMTFGELVRGWGRATGKHRLYLPLPSDGERVTEQMAWTLARLPRRKTRLLLEALREPQVSGDPSRRFPLPHRPLTYREALSALLPNGRGGEQDDG